MARVSMGREVVSHVKREVESHVLYHPTRPSTVKKIKKASRLLNEHGLWFLN